MLRARVNVSTEVASQAVVSHLRSGAAGVARGQMQSYLLPYGLRGFPKREVRPQHNPIALALPLAPCLVLPLAHALLPSGPRLRPYSYTVGL